MLHQTADTRWVALCCSLAIDGNCGAVRGSTSPTLPLRHPAQPRFVFSLQTCCIFLAFSIFSYLACPRKPFSSQDALASTNMEALAALGVAASAVQFATFASNLISNAVEIHGSAKGAAEHVLSMETIYGQLSGLASALAAASASEYLPPVNNKAVPPSGEESNKSTTTAAIQVLSHQCRDDCHQLLSIVAKLKSQDATGSRRRWDSFRLALRTLWSKKDIQDLESRLSKTQTSLTLSVVKLTA